MSDIIVDDPHHGTRESWSERHLLQAIVLLEDAYSFRSIAHKLSPLNILKLYRLYWSKWIQRLLTFVVSCQLLLIFIQFPSSFSRTSDLRQERNRVTLPCGVQIAIEFICLIIFYIDVIIRVRKLRVDLRSFRSFDLGLFNWIEDRSKKTMAYRVFHCYNCFYDRSYYIIKFRMSSKSRN